LVLVLAFFVAGSHFWPQINPNAVAQLLQLQLSSVQFAVCGLLPEMQAARCSHQWVKGQPGG